MEALTQLMSLIDLNSKSLPEGEYLKACNYMKDIYKHVPRPTSPEVHLPRPAVDSDSEDDDADFELRPIRNMTNELHAIAVRIGEATRQIRQRERDLKNYKIKKRVTAYVRRAAIKERAQQLGLRMREYTIDELRIKGHQIMNERNFFKSYLERQNLLTQGLILDIQDEIVEITNYREAEKVKYRDFHIAVHGRPPP